MAGKTRVKKTSNIYGTLAWVEEDPDCDFDFDLDLDLEKSKTPR